MNVFELQYVTRAASDGLGSGFSGHEKIRITIQVYVERGYGQWALLDY